MNAPVSVDPREDAYAMPLDKIDVSQPRLYQDDIWHPYFERLRREDPVHWCENGMYGSYWSVTRYRDIMQVDTSQQTYSSDAMMGGIVLRDTPMDYRRPSFISMDPPKHDEQRKVVSPIVAPMNLARCPARSASGRSRILDGLPRGETFDWVDRVSIELTTQMLATLFDFPFEERRKLTYWSNVATVNTRAGTEIDSEEKRDAVLQQALEYFAELWHERAEAAAAAGPDLDAGARRGDARSAVAAAGVHGQSAAAAGRRQRHDAQLDVRRSVGAEQVSRPVPQAAGRSRRWSPAWCRRSSATRRR